MEPLALWEKILVGVVAVLVLLWVSPGIKRALAQSRESEKDWRAVLIPLALVILLVMLMIASVRGG